MPNADRSTRRRQILAKPSGRLFRIALFLGVVTLMWVDCLLASGITVQEFREKVERSDSFFLIDVREPWEREEFNLGGELIPLGQLLEAGTIDAIRAKQSAYASGEIVVYDRTGARSGQAQFLLQNHGIQDVRSLTGGVLAWIEAFGNVRPQPRPDAPTSPPPPPPPESVQSTTDAGTEDTSAPELVTEGASEETTSGAEPAADDPGSDETFDEDGASGEVDPTAVVDTEAEAMSEDDPGDEVWDDEMDVSTDAADEGEDDVAPEDDPSDEN